MDGKEARERRTFPRVSGHAPLTPRTRSVARWMFYGHLWLGVVATGIVLVLAISGILLNHKRPLGLMPDVPHAPSGSLTDALPMGVLAERAAGAAPQAAGAGVDRMDVRPRDGVIKVRFRDDVVTEVTLDINDGRVLHVGERNDVFLEKLHSGEVFGAGWVLLSDFGAVALIILIVTGYWLWLFPRTRQ
jgi:hypothetical protein